MYIRCACVARILWAPDQLLHKGHDHHTHPHSPSLVVLAAPTGTRTRRARLQRDGIGAKGTFSPLPVTVNPCLHAMSPLTVVEGSAVAPSPPSRAWLHAGALRVTPILRLCRFPCCRASCDSLLLLLLPPPPRPPPHLGIVGWCGKLVWTSSPLSSRSSLVPASKGRCRFVPPVEQLGVVAAPSIAAAPPLSIERLLAL